MRCEMTSIYEYESEKYKLASKIKMVAPELDMAKFNLRKLEIIWEILRSGKIDAQTISNNMDKLEVLYALSNIMK